jgi:hypothetical protein
MQEETGPGSIWSPGTPRASGSNAMFLALVLSEVLLAPMLAAVIEVAREARRERERLERDDE